MRSESEIESEQIRKQIISPHIFHKISLSRLITESACLFILIFFSKCHKSKMSTILQDLTKFDNNFNKIHEQHITKS